MLSKHRKKLVVDFNGVKMMSRTRQSGQSHLQSIAEQSQANFLNQDNVSRSETLLEDDELQTVSKIDRNNMSKYEIVKCDNHSFQSMNQSS